MSAARYYIVQFRNPDFYTREYASSDAEAIETALEMYERFKGRPYAGPLFATPEQDFQATNPDVDLSEVKSTEETLEATANA